MGPRAAGSVSCLGPRWRREGAWILRRAPRTKGRGGAAGPPGSAHSTQAGGDAAQIDCASLGEIRLLLHGSMLDTPGVGVTYVPDYETTVLPLSFGAGQLDMGMTMS